VSDIYSSADLKLAAQVDDIISIAVKGSVLDWVIGAEV
jgi:hypothetical protein